MVRLVGNFKKAKKKPKPSFLCEKFVLAEVICSILNFLKSYVAEIGISAIFKNHVQLFCLWIFAEKIEKIKLSD